MCVCACKQIHMHEDCYTYMIDGDVRPRAAHAGTAVHQQRARVQLALPHQRTHGAQKVQRRGQHHVARGVQRDVVVRPLATPEVMDGVLHLPTVERQLREDVRRVVFFGVRSDGDVAECHGVMLFCGKVGLAFLLAQLDEVCEHHDRTHTRLPDHAHE